MKKWLSVVCAGVMLLSVFTATIGAEAAQPVIFSASTATCTEGETVQIAIAISEDHYTVNGRLHIGYDPTLLELVAVSDDIDDPYIGNVNTTILNSDVMWASNLAAPGDYRFVYVTSASQGVADGGTLFTLTFKALSVDAAEAAVTVTVVEARANDGVTEGGGDFAPALAVADGGVTIEASTIRGDVNDDGDISLADALMLFQAVNGKIQLNDEQLAAADLVAPDGVTINDALRLFQYVNGKVDAP